MTYFEIYTLIQEKRWTELLRGLEPGEHELAFPSLNDIKSCKATAYEMNSNNGGRLFRFHVDKRASKVTLKVIDEY